MPSRSSDGTGGIAKRPDAGTSLVETMLSVVLLGTALLGIAGTSAHVGAGLNATHEKTRALKVAQQQLEVLMAAPYEEVQNGTTQKDGVTLNWTVAEADVSKEIVLAYGYKTKDRVRVERLTVALVKT